MTASVDMHVDPESFRALRQELYGFDRELLGKLNSRIKRSVAPVVSDAESEMGGIASIGRNLPNGRREQSPLARKYAAGKRGVQVKVGGRSRSDVDAVVRLIGRNGAVSMLEFAATPHSESGAQLIGMAQRKFGGTGRFLWDAMDRHEDDVLADIREEVAKTEAEYSTRLKGGTASGVIY